MRLADLFSWSGGDVGTWEALRCPGCAMTYRVGNDSSVATWEQLRAIAYPQPELAALFAKSGFGSTRSGQHDSIKAMPDWNDTEARLRAAEIFAKVRAAIAGGAKRRWTCANCQRTDIRYPRQ